MQRLQDDRRSRDFGGVEELSEQNESAMLSTSVRAESRPLQWLGLRSGAELLLDRVHSRSEATDELGVTRRRIARFPDGASTLDADFYLEADARLGPLLALAGVRAGHHRRDVPSADRGLGQLLTGETFTGDAAVLLQPVRGLELFLRGATAVRVPNVFDLSAIGARPGNRFMIPTSDLRPERATGAEAGARFSAARVSIEASTFYTYVDDRIESIATGVVRADGRREVQSANIASAHLTGMELSAQAAPFSRIEAFGTFSFAYGVEGGAGIPFGPASRVPPANGVIGLRARPIAELELSSYVRYAAPQRRLSTRDLEDPRIDPRGTRAWATWSFRGGWNLSEHLAIVAVLENVLDHRYREHGSGIDGPGAQLILSVDARW
jgi:outer membrane receptor protein involved in Fe transport